MNEICGMSVHDWKIPKEGDIGLTCDRCEDFVDFSTIEEELQMSILEGRKKYYGALVGGAFERAFFDVFQADQISGRWDTIQQEEPSPEAMEGEAEGETEGPINPLIPAPC